MTRPFARRDGWAAIAALVAAGAMLSGCADKPLPTGGFATGPRFSIVAELHQQQVATAQSIHVFAGYAVTGGSPVILADQSVSVSTGTQPVTLSVDISACLSDATRVGPSGSCPLVVGVIAKDAAGAPIDSMLAGPFSVAPGASAAPLAVALNLVDLAMVASGDTIRVQAPAGATTAGNAAFLSSDTSIAVVSSTGVVSARSVGIVTITTTLGPATAATRLQVTPSPSRSIATGDFLTCALDVTGAAWCWGLGTSGQLGNGGSASSSSPVKVSGGLTFTQISAGGAMACGLTNKQSVYCWGSDFNGALGNGTSGSAANSSVPVQVSSTQKFQAVVTGGGGFFACGLNVAGAAYCWGSNIGGALGTGDTVTANITVPTAVVGGATFRSISAGLTHACALTTAGTGYCWGRAASGWSIAGNGSIASLPSPMAVGGGLTFSTLSAGALYSCGLTTGGAAYCWGLDRFGTSGIGLSSLAGGLSGPGAATVVPTAVQGGLVFQWLYADASNFTFQKATCGLIAPGAAYCWGSNMNGAIGTTVAMATCAGTSTITFPCTGAPVAVATTATFAVLVSGSGQTCGITKTHTLLCWGDNTDGQVGDGTTTNRLTPSAPISAFKVP